MYWVKIMLKFLPPRRSIPWRNTSVMVYRPTTPFVMINSVAPAASSPFFLLLRLCLLLSSFQNFCTLTFIFKPPSPWNVTLNALAILDQINILFERFSLPFQHEFQLIIPSEYQNYISTCIPNVHSNSRIPTSRWMHWVNLHYSLKVRFRLSYKFPSIYTPFFPIR